jgi:Domain of unknown function (DUF4398)
MTRSKRNWGLALALLLQCGSVFAANPPDAEMAAAAAAIAGAERAGPRGPAAEVLAMSREKFARAQDAVARKKYRDAAQLADEARAIADLALANARLVNAQDAFDEKSARNADLRRQLLVLPEGQQ